ncbi:MAG TPA: VWA domain-containing protein [Verrucomicrobiae bacterium]|nr:VWA domain-containing protein [Verrucomicrobiae bacterium]
MIPFLTYPLALIALATVPALAAIYILRNRFRRRPVSSLVLWRFHVQSKSGGAKVHKLQLPLLFFLELLALILLVAAASGPQWKLPQSARPLIVILDDSFSMRAARDNVSAQARAKDFLKELFRRQPPPSTRLILAGTQSRLLGSTARNWREVNDLLPDWKCWSPGAAIDSAITLAAEIGKQQANILVLTDHKPADEKISNPRLEWHAFGSPLDNLAFVNASRTAFGDEDRCLLEIANYSADAHTAKLTLSSPSPPLEERVGVRRPPVAENQNPSPQPSPRSGGERESIISLGAHQTQRLVFNIPSGAPSLRAKLDNDALAVDNEAQLLPPIRKRVRVQVALTNEALAALANRTLDATGLRAAISQDPELVIHDTDAPVGSNAWSLVWSTVAATNAYTGPFIVDTSHPLANGIALEGVVWAATAITNASGDVPVILAGNTPLFSTREDAIGRRHLTLNLNPDLSTLQNTPDWPILFWNVLQWRIAALPGLKESNARLGSEVVLKTTGEAVTVTQPDGQKQSFPKTGGELALETPMPGIYSVAAGQATNSFSVNALAADESDLSSCTSGQWGSWSEDTEQRLVEASTVWIFGVLALGLLCAHLYLVATSKGAT